MAELSKLRDLHFRTKTLILPWRNKQMFVRIINPASESLNIVQGSSADTASETEPASAGHLMLGSSGLRKCVQMWFIFMDIRRSQPTKTQSLPGWGASSDGVNRMAISTQQDVLPGVRSEGTPRSVSGG